MKKSFVRTASVLLSLLLVFTMLSLSACKVKIGGEETTEVDGVEGANAYGSAFIANSVAQENFTMILKVDDESVLTFERNGTIAKAAYADDTLYAFIDEDGNYCLAVDSLKEIYDDSKENYYDPVLGTATTWLQAFFLYNEEETDWSYHTLQKDITENGKKVSTIEISSEGTLEGVDSKLIVKGVAIDGLVQSADAIYTLGEESQLYSIAFTYGNATVTLPDFSDYKRFVDEETGSAIEIDFDEFFNEEENGEQ